MYLDVLFDEEMPWEEESDHGADAKVQGHRQGTRRTEQGTWQGTTSRLERWTGAG